MNWNKSPLAFEDVRDAFDRALAAERGIKITCETRAEVVRLRSRFNYFRKMNRADNKTTYPEGHRLHNNSAYDELILRIPPKGTPEETALFIEHRSMENMKIEEL